MIIQSTRVWTGKAFEKLQIELEHGKINGVYRWGSRGCEFDYKDARRRPGYRDVDADGA